MASYTRQSTFSDGDLITAELFNDEYNQLLAAFENTTGHKHDGTVGEGPVISIIGDAGLATPLNKILIDTTNDHIEFWVDVSGTSTQQLYITDGAILPVTDNDIDLGSNSLQFKDLYINGTANIDTVDIDAGTIDGVTIGGNSAGAITGTTITATNFVIGSASINETELEILDGATLTTTELNYVDGVTSSIQTQINTKAPLASPSLTGIPTAPTAASNTNTTQIATTAYVQAELTDLIDGAPGTLDTLNELAAAINDDANYNTTLTTALATKLPLAGGTMTGNVTYSDNVKAQFGTSQDLQIYHNGSNSYIKDGGTGELLVQSNLVAIQNAAATENMAKFIENGAVELNYNDVKKLATTSTGIDVTGAITSSGNIFMSTNGSILRNTGGALQLQSDASVVILRSNNTTALTLDTSQNATFAGTISSGAITSSGNVTLSSTAPLLYLTNTTSGTGKAWRFSSAANGKLFITQEGVIDAVTLDHTTGNATFAGAITTAKNDNTFTVQSTNAGQASVDIKNTEGHFRLITDAGELKVYDQTDSRTPFLINSSGNIGIGASSPTETLHVMSGVSNDTVAIISGSQSDRGLTISTYASDGRTDGGVDFDAYKSFKFTTDGSERARITSGGNFLVAKTSEGSSTMGVEARVSGQLFATSDSNKTLFLNRLNNHGDIVDFRKDGTTVGKIGIQSSGFYIDGEASHSGLRFTSAGITPRLNHTESDNTVNLGESGIRFKDLHLSGTANFGSLSDGTITITGFVDEDNMSSNSATLVPTQQSVKAYVDSQISSAGGNGISFADNEKAQFGDGNDLQIYHDGNNSRVEDTGTGGLRLIGGNFVSLQSTSGENMVVATENGAVTLYHNNNAKLATTSTGIDVTGTVKGDGLIINGGATSPTHLINGSRAGTLVSIDNESTSTSTGLLLNTASTNANSNILQVTSNDLNRFKVSGNGDISFYDDTGSTQGLFWDASAERLGLGTTSPATAIHAQSSTAEASRSLRLAYDGTYYFDLKQKGAGGIVYNAVGAATGRGHRWELDGSEKARLNSTGLGIGTTSPSSLLHLSSSAPVFTLTSTSGNGGTHTIKSTGVNGDALQITAENDIYLNGDNIYFRKANETQHMRLTSTGNLGIGTSSPTSKLEVKSSGSTANEISLVHSGNTVKIASLGQESSHGSLILRNNGGVNQVRLSAGGNSSYILGSNFGIGTSSPDGNLEVVTSTVVSGVSDTVNNVLIGLQASNRPTIVLDTADTTYTNRTWNITNVGAVGSLVIGRHGLDVLNLKNDGKVGIGTSSPSSALHIGNAGHILLERGGELRSKDTSSAIRTIARVNGSNELQYGWSSAGAVTFMGGGSYTERMRIHTNGNIGVGTSSPNKLLHINQSGNTIPLLVQTNDHVGIAVKGGNSHDRYISFQQTNGSVGGKIGWDHSSQALKLNAVDTFGSTHLAVDVNGKVGIGTASPSYNLDLLASNAVSMIRTGDTTSPTLGLFVNSGSNGVGTISVDNGGHMTFDTASTGAGQAERMRIDSSGRVGIGTSSPSTALHVSAPDGNAELILQRTGAAASSWGLKPYNGDFFIRENGTDRVTIKAGGNFGINTTSPASPLHVNGNVQVGVGNSKEAFIQATNSGRVASNPAYSFNGDVDTGMFNPNTDNTIAFATGGSERARIDASGNVMLGKTSVDAGATQGFEFRADLNDLLYLARAGNAITLNRLSSDGDIALFRKDGTTIGSIGVIHGNNLFIGGTSHSGLQFGGSIIYPTGGTGSANDATVDLGASATRFKDLYLSGHLKTGGGGSNSTGEIEFVADSTRARIVGGYQGGGGGYLKFHTDTTGGSDLERARFDSSGNLLIGKTSADIGTIGHQLLSDVSGDYAAHTSNGTRALLLNRLNSDGQIAEFRKDGSVIGSIGSYVSLLYLGKGDTTLLFDDANDHIVPRGTNGGARDGAINLGSSGNRFKDLHLGGNANIAGLVGINKSVNTSVGLSVGSDADSSTSYGLEVTDSSNQTRFLVDGAGSQRFYGSDNSETARFTNGSLGIGDSAPQDYLEINGSGRGLGGLTISNSSASHAALSFARSSTATARIKTSEPDALHTSALHFQTSNASGGSPNLVTAMYIDENQKVGIGTTSPNALADLHVADTTDARIWLDATSGNTLELYAGSGVGLFNRSNNFLNFGTDNVERMRIDSSGNVGIKNSNPTATLTVGTLSSGQTGNVVINNEGGNTATLEVLSRTNRSILKIADNDTIGYMSAEGGILSIGRNSGSNAANINIDSSNNVGIGITSPVAPLHVSTAKSSVTDSVLTLQDSSSTFGKMIEFVGEGSTDFRGVIGFQEPQGNAPELYISNGGTEGTGNGVGLAFWSYTLVDRIAPCDNVGDYRDNAIDLGWSNARFDDIYATNGTIQTSDRNDKQDIQALTDAETRVATACKGLLRKFRWQDAVTEKGDEARYHFGIISQDLQDAFTAEGLDAGDYGMFISQTWEDSNGVEQTRLGVRYSELLAFIIAAI